MNKSFVTLMNASCHTYAHTHSHTYTHTHTHTLSLSFSLSHTHTHIQGGGVCAAAPRERDGGRGIFFAMPQFKFVYHARELTHFYVNMKKSCHTYE